MMGIAERLMLMMFVRDWYSYMAGKTSGETSKAIIELVDVVNMIIGDIRAEAKGGGDPDAS